jgi:murein DD-endopeptidase MepM/ murein hydrolase activator NlpD
MDSFVHEREVFVKIFFKFWLITALSVLTFPLSAQEGNKLSLSGPLIQGGMIRGETEPGSKIFLDEKPVKISENGKFVIGFHRDAKTKWILKIKFPHMAWAEQVLTVKPRTYNIERVDGLPQKTVNIPPEDLARRKREGGMVRAARADQSSAMDWTQQFILPAKGRISGVYGSQRVLNGEPRFPHYGLDVAAPTGSPIWAPAAGRVVLADPDFLLEGGIVMIDHGFGITSALFHMNSVDVKTGMVVKQGDQIGTVGAKGRASGPHVDWRVNWYSVRLDPALLVAE